MSLSPTLKKIIDAFEADISKHHVELEKEIGAANVWANLTARMMAHLMVTVTRSDFAKENPEQAAQNLSQTLDRIVTQAKEAADRSTKPIIH